MTDENGAAASASPESEPESPRADPRSLKTAQRNPPCEQPRPAALQTDPRRTCACSRLLMHSPLAVSVLSVPLKLGQFYTLYERPLRGLSPVCKTRQDTQEGMRIGGIHPTLRRTRYMHRSETEEARRRGAPELATG